MTRSTGISTVMTTFGETKSPKGASFLLDVYLDKVLTFSIFYRRIETWLLQLPALCVEGRWRMFHLFIHYSYEEYVAGRKSQDLSEST